MWSKFHDRWTPKHMLWLILHRISIMNVWKHKEQKHFVQHFKTFLSNYFHVQLMKRKDDSVLLPLQTKKGVAAHFHLAAKATQMSIDVTFWGNYSLHLINGSCLGLYCYKLFWVWICPLHSMYTGVVLHASFIIISFPGSNDNSLQYID